QHRTKTFAPKYVKERIDQAEGLANQPNPAAISINVVTASDCVKHESASLALPNSYSVGTPRSIQCVRTWLRLTSLAPVAKSKTLQTLFSGLFRDGGLALSCVLFMGPNLPCWFVGR